MFSSLFKTFYGIFIFIIVFIIFITCFFSPIILSCNFSNLTNENYFADINSSAYLWPAPGYTSINSYFGKRSSPTAGASSYHKGIDIGAPEGSNILAVCDGKITFTGFLGGGGYTITLSVNNMKITYCHVSPIYVVHTGDIVKKGDIVRLCWPQKCIWCCWKPVS